ncbi:MAG: ParB/RepB/Spo0J family partition protein [Pseudomonadales bacterium]|nr:ParB/RepB/Spo0J family partition protein [Gammaproteobacteria bacterium]MBP6479553.1 ParB/RepB/Spo0J family partition protein [Pseudomonadales bacterium]MBP7910657.1 ParB/RepB/Spo0J family partition protein [Pseudomonadales bacterium]
MVVKKRGLGRGLDALIGAASFGQAATDAQPGARPEELRSLPVDLVQRGRYQPRRDFNPEALEELANSIRTQGLMQPIVVRPVGGERYEIIAGERRWRAAQMAGLGEIAVIVRDVPDEAAIAMALIENIQREDLNAIEEAVALQRLQQEFGLTHEQIAEAVGKSRTTVTNIMRLLGLAPEVRDHLEAGRLEMGHGRALLTLAPEQQLMVAREVLEKDLTVRETEALVRRIQAPTRPAPAPAAENADIRRLERELSEIVGATIAIEHKTGGKGRMVINYSNLDQLDGILRYFRPEPG